MKQIIKYFTVAILCLLVSSSSVDSEDDTEESLTTQNYRAIRRNRKLRNLISRDSGNSGGTDPDNVIPRLDNRPALHFLNPNRRKCNRNIRIVNGKRRFLDGGSIVRFRCEHGFLLFGSPSAACIRGQWSEPTPSCIRWGCNRLAIPTGTVGRPLYGGAAIYFECLPGYEMRSGSSSILVCDGYRWNGSVPLCQSTATTTTSTSTAGTEEIITTASTIEPEIDEDLMGTWPEEVTDSTDWITFAVKPNNTNHVTTLKPDWTIAVDLDKSDYDSQAENTTKTTNSITHSTISSAAHSASTAAPTLAGSTTFSTTKTTTTATATTSSSVPAGLTATATTVNTTTNDVRPALAPISPNSTATRINSRAPKGWDSASNSSSGAPNATRDPLNTLRAMYGLTTPRSFRWTTPSAAHMRCLLLTSRDQVRECLLSMSNHTLLPRPKPRPWSSGGFRWNNASITPGIRWVHGVPVLINSTTSSTTTAAVTRTISSARTTVSTTSTTKATFTTTTRHTNPATTAGLPMTIPTTRRPTTSTLATTTTTTRPTTTTLRTTKAPKRTATSTPRIQVPNYRWATPKARVPTTTRRAHMPIPMPTLAPPAPSHSIAPPSSHPDKRVEYDNTIEQRLDTGRTVGGSRLDHEVKREFITPFKLDTNSQGVEPGEGHSSAVTVTMSVILVLIGLAALIAFVVHKFWRGHMGISRPSRHDSDRRNLSTSLDMEEEFVYFSNRR